MDGGRLGEYLQIDFDSMHSMGSEPLHSRLCLVDGSDSHSDRDPVGHGGAALVDTGCLSAVVRIDSFCPDSCTDAYSLDISLCSG